MLYSIEITNKLKLFFVFSLAHYRHPSVLYSNNAKYATISSAIEAIPTSTFESIEYSGLFVKVSNEIYLNGHQVYFTLMQVF